VRRLGNRDSRGGCERGGSVRYGKKLDLENLKRQGYHLAVQKRGEQMRNGVKGEKGGTRKLGSNCGHAVRTIRGEKRLAEENKGRIRKKGDSGHR